MIRVKPQRWNYAGLLGRMEAGAAKGVNRAMKEMEAGATSNIISPESSSPAGLSNQGYLGGKRAPRQYPHDASGNLLGQISTDAANPGKNPVALVESAAPYSYDLNYGTPPGTTTVTADDILLWADSKGLQDHRGNPPSQKWAERVVSRIRRRGMAGTWFWTSAVNEVKAKFQQIMKEEVLRG